jgi:predicted phage terminase large subunit-like protein
VTAPPPRDLLALRPPATARTVAVHGLADVDADAAERVALREQAQVDLARARLIDFVRYVTPGYHAGWLHREICRKLEQFLADCMARRSPRLIIAVPPRHGKTAIVSQRFPVWALGHWPGAEIVCASYGQELADDNSRIARETARSEQTLKVFPHLKPRHAKKRFYADYRRTDVDKINFWKVGGGEVGAGSYKAVGVGGPLTGRGAHIGIIDDPFKDREEADSAARRKTVWGWYQSTFYTRLAPGGGIIVMATRWHEDDLTGRLLKEMYNRDEPGDQWEIVNFPAIAEVDEVHRKRGEPLHAVRYPLERLQAIRRALGSREWAALYQQRPTPDGGALWKREWFQYYKTDPQRMPMDEIGITVDCSFRKREDSDFVVMQAWGRREKTKYYLLDQVRGRMSYVETKQALRMFAAKWRHRRFVMVEAKANGDALIDDLKGEITGLIAYDPGNASKEARAELAAVAYEAGQVWIPDPTVAPWVGDFVEEHVAFPAATNDDQVDAGAQIVNRWQHGAIDVVANARETWKLWING